MKRITALISMFVALLFGNPILWHSEVINEYQIEPTDSQYLELRWIATGSSDTSYNNPFDIYGTQIVMPCGTSYVDTSITIYDSSRILIDSSMVQGDFLLSSDSGFVQVSHLLDYLVWNPDPTPASGSFIDSCLGSIFYGEYATTHLPPYLDRFKTIFVCAGIYPNNYIIQEGSVYATALEAYLQSGGCVYLEGGDVWYYDPLNNYGHDFGPTFGIHATEDGTGDMGPVIGQYSTFTEGMDFPYDGENGWMDHISPTGTGFLIFQDGDNNYDCGVANDAGGYRTVGTSYELGALVDGTLPSTRWTLLYSIMYFFGYSEWTMVPFRDTVFYPDRMPVPPPGYSASAFYIFYYDMGYAGYYVRQDWYIDSTPTFGASNDDYPGCMVSGHVYDPLGSPLSGVEVTASLHEQAWIDVVEKPPFHACCTTFTGSDGSYVLDSLLPWQYEICADMYGYARDSIVTSYLKSLEPLCGIDFHLNIGINESADQEAGLVALAYPNPFNNVFTLMLSDPVLHIDIYDITGRQRLRVDNKARQRTIIIDAGGLPSGIYFIPAVNSKFKIIKN